MKLRLLPLLSCIVLVSAGVDRNATRPAIVNIGAIFSFNSTIGRFAKVAIEAAVDDVNADPTVLRGAKLSMHMQDTNCDEFLGIVGALEFMETDIVGIIGPQSSVIAHVIAHVATELQVPLLSFAATDPTLSSLQYPFFVRTTHSDAYQMRAVANLVDFYQWRQVIAVYVDDDFGRIRIWVLGESTGLLSGKFNGNSAADVVPRDGIVKPRKERWMSELWEKRATCRIVYCRRPVARG